MLRIILFFLIICIMISTSTGAFAQDHENIERISRLYSSIEGPKDVVAIEDILYVASHISGLQIFDVSDPGSIELIGLWDDNEGIMRDLVNDGDYFYLTDHLGGLYVVDVSDPQAPVAVAQHDIGGFARKIDIQGDYAYVTEIPLGLRIFDISNPDAPTEISQQEVEHSPNGITVWGDVAVVSAHEIYLIDISNPEQPREINRIRPPDGSASVSEISGDLLITLVGNGGFCIYDIGDPENEELLCHYNGYFHEALRIVEDVLFIAAVDWGVIAYDISDPANPIRIDNVRFNGNPLGIDIEDEAAYVATSDLGVHIFDVADLENMEVVGQIYDPVRVSDIEVFNDIVFVANGLCGVTAVDIGDVEDPFEIGRCDTPGSVKNIAINGEIACVTIDNIGVVLIDIGDPEEMEEIGRTGALEEPVQVEIRGEYCFVIEDRSGFYIFDISDPTNPELIMNYDDRGSFKCFDMDDRFAYVANNSIGCIMIDISDPENAIVHDPLEFEEIEPGFIKVQIWDNKLFRSVSGGVRIYDISDIEETELLSFIPVNGTMMRIFVRSDILFAATDYNGFFAFDVSDPRNPDPVGFYNTPGDVEAILESGNSIVVADRTNLGIYNFSDPAGVGDSCILHPSSFIFFTPYPNPFNSTTTITYGLQNPGNVTLQLYNPLGQRISTLFEGNRQTGVYSANLAGKDLSSGLYFVRLGVAGQMFTRKVMLVR